MHDTDRQHIDQREIVDYITSHFEGVNVVVATEGLPAGDTFFIYDPRRDLEPKHQQPFATIVTKDYGDFDAASNLNRPGVWRLNIGVGRDAFLQLFPDDAQQHDYTALDRLMPHPVYSAQRWLCVLNPSRTTFAGLHPLLDEAYGIAVARVKTISAEA